MLNEPKPGEASYAKWREEKDSLYGALARKSKMVHAKLNAIDGVSCQVPPIPLTLPCLPASLPHFVPPSLPPSLGPSLPARRCFRPRDASIPTCISLLTLPIALPPKADFLSLTLPLSRFSPSPPPPCLLRPLAPAPPPAPRPPLPSAPSSPHFLSLASLLGEGIGVGVQHHPQQSEDFLWGTSTKKRTK